MNRISSFLVGMVAGAALLYGAMSYHFVQTEDGIVMVPKLSKGLTDPYVDIREFSLDDWQEHRGLAAALVQADRADVLADVSLDRFRNSINGALDGLFGTDR